jgi:hypothetical protein
MAAPSLQIFWEVDPPVTLRLIAAAQYPKLNIASMFSTQFDVSNVCSDSTIDRPIAAAQYPKLNIALSCTHRPRLTMKLVSI